MVEKFTNSEGKIAVLISPGFGAGWSTWANAESVEFAMFDKELVQLALDKVDRKVVDEFMISKEMDYFYTGGWEDIEIAWLEPETKFTIKENDGNESLRAVSDLSFLMEDRIGQA